MPNIDKTLIRLLIDLVRDELPKNQNQNYLLISKSLNILLNSKFIPEELEEADLYFKKKIILNTWFAKKEYESIQKDPSSDLNKFAERIKQRKQREKHIEYIIKSYLKNRLKEGKIKNGSGYQDSS